ncbi:MAG: CpaF family protein [Phycisphaera sp.]|nr:CpaF family protein [Phycisphaera sp.]
MISSGAEEQTKLETSKQEIFAATVAHYLAPIKKYLDNTRVAEVMVNKFDEIYVEMDGKMSKVPEVFPDRDAYAAAVNNILQFTGKSLYDEASLIDARLPDGSRVHVAKEPCSRFGMAMTIRKFSKSMLDIDWLVHIGSLTDQICEYLRIAVNAEANVLVAGGTSSGKTSLLNALSSYIPNTSRIVVIEDSSELQLQQDHVISMETKPPDRYGRGHVGIRELFRSSLRLRPDRIVIGEVRGGEALDMIQAMTSGHGGSMGTLHANNPYDALNRLETMALMSKVELPLYALRSQAASAIDVIVQMTRHMSGARVCSAIAEVLPIGEDGNYHLQDVFRMERMEDETGKHMQLKWTGVRSILAKRLKFEHEEMVTELTAPVFGLEGDGEEPHMEESPDDA